MPGYRKSGLPRCRAFATLGTLRAASLTGLLAVAVVSLAAALLPAPALARDRLGASTLRAPTASLAESVRARINAIRRTHGLNRLRAAPGLVRSARGHALAMATGGYFGHDSSDGASAGERIRRHYRGTLVGETLLWRSPGVSAYQAVALWMASPPHRRVLLHPGFRDAGLGVVRASAAPGAFGGLNVTIVVADFGAP
jgi:uncharacterized protein YkwD